MTMTWGLGRCAVFVGVVYLPVFSFVPNVRFCVVKQ